MRRMEVLWVTLFVLTWFPVGMLVATTLAGTSQSYPQDFSIYNDQWNGLSAFREQIEGTGREVKTIQSSMSVISRYNGDAVLVIMGPVKDFSIEAVLVVFEHLRAGGGILIADDFGTANSSFFLLNQFIAASTQFSGLIAFTGGVLLDLDSYDRSPKLPVITDIRSYPQLTDGVSSLHLNWATALSPRSVLGMRGIAWTTTRTWCETNITDPNPYPSEGEWNGSLPVVGALDLGVNGGRIVAVSDPSLFTNDMIDRGNNEVFSGNAVEWLSNDNTTLPVVFCEDLLAVPWQSTEFFFGLYMGRVFWLSTLPFFSTFYPLVTLVGIRKYLPDPKKPEVKSVSEVFLRRGQTYFGERMAYYRTEGNYARVVKMLYRKLMRDIRRKYGWVEYDSNKVWEEVRIKDPKMRQEDFFITIRRIEEISSDPSTKIKEGEMMNLFFFIRTIESLLIEVRK